MNQAVQSEVAVAMGRGTPSFKRIDVKVGSAVEYRWIQCMILRMRVDADFYLSWINNFERELNFDSFSHSCRSSREFPELKRLMSMEMASLT